jgi:hypothetical protein
MTRQQRGRRKKIARDFYERRRNEREEPWCNKSASLNVERQAKIKQIMALGGQVNNKTQGTDL